MTGTELATLIRTNTRTNSTTYTDAQLLVDTNLAKDILASRIQVRRPDIWNMPFRDDLVADQREYSFPANVMNHLKTVELKPESANDDYVLARYIPRENVRIALEEDAIKNRFDNKEPRFFVRRQAIFILSGAISTVTDGIQVVADIFPANLSNLTGSTDLSVDPSTTTHGFPREFHVLWATLVGMTYKQRNEMALGPLELNFENDLERSLREFTHPVQDQSDGELFGSSDIRAYS